MDGQRRRVLDLLDLRSGHVAGCLVEYDQVGDERNIHVALRHDGSRVAEATSTVDFEEALTTLRATLERGDRLLLCNRYRADAFVSSMSRQMTDGLACYLVEPGLPVDPARLVDVFAPAPSEKVVRQAAADEYIARWMADFDD